MTHEADIEPGTDPESKPEELFINSATGLEQPKFRCKNGHVEIGTMAFWAAPGAPVIHCCLICWRDWMLAQGWEATEIKP